MKILNSKDPQFPQEFQKLKNRARMDISNVLPHVISMLDSIQTRGIKALCEQVAQFDLWNPRSLRDLLLPQSELKNAYDRLDSAVKRALHQAYDRIVRFHEKQKSKSWLDFEPSGTMLGQKVEPLRRAGLYIPGGKAAYPSSLLMNAIPAQVAGVEEIVVCSPTPRNEPNPLVLATAFLCDVHEFYKVGGVGAIGMMAYGIKGVEKVDVITGPGNIYVATAKKMVFGEVKIDMIAGPSEILIIADGSANPAYLAYDLLAQAEHDEMASALLLTTDATLAKAVESEIQRLLPTLPRQNIAAKSLQDRSCIIVCESVQECLKLSNILAPEHLELMLENALSYLPYVKNCGAIFLGAYSPEAVGDYIAGPNHTLPTGGGAHFFSPLSVDHFVKKSSILCFSKQGFEEVAGSCEILANLEGLGAHAQSVGVRKDKKK